MFAISGSSVQALDILNQMLARGEATDQADRDRAAKFAMLKVQSDEHELDRLNNMVMATQEQVVNLETEFARLGGMRGQMSDDPKSQGSSIVQANMYNLSTDAQGAKQSLSDLEKKRVQLINNISEFSDAAMRYSPNIFKEYSEQDEKKQLSERSVISEEEWKAFIEEEGDNYSTIQLRGIRAGMAGMEKEKFDMLEREEKLKQGALQLALSKASATATNAMAPWIDKIKQWRQTQTNLGSEEQFGPTGGFVPSDVLTKASDFSESLFDITNELARFAGKGSDWYDTEGELGDLFDMWESAKSISDQDLMAATAMGIQQILRQPGRAKKELDYSIFKSDDPELQYIAHLVRGIDLYAGAQETAYPGAGDGMVGIYSNIIKETSGKSDNLDTGGYATNIIDSIIQGQGMLNAVSPWSNILNQSSGKNVVADMMGIDYHLTRDKSGKLKWQKKKEKK